jgi:hypothetical protein
MGVVCEAEGSKLLRTTSILQIEEGLCTNRADRRDRRAVVPQIAKPWKAASAGNS